jgi:hypothetical protein
MPEFKWEVTLP